MSFHVPEQYRLTSQSLGVYRSTEKDGNNGAFAIRRTNGRDMFIIASDEEGWEHVSVHIQSGKKLSYPRWDEMCMVKDLFWDDEDVVVQYHPKKSEYVNLHPTTLHLWRPIGMEFPTPSSYMVGLKLDV